MTGILNRMKANQTSIGGLKLLLLGLIMGIVSCDGGSSGGTGMGSSPGAQDPAAGPLSVVMVTDKGAFEIELHAAQAPRSVANFCNLVQRGFYHNTDFTAANAVARTLGETPRKPDYQLPQEFSTELLFDKPGVVAWTSLPRSSEEDDFFPHPTRFFLTVAPQERWNFQYVPFGTVVSGLDVLQNASVGDWIKSARVKGDPTPLFERYADDLASWNAALARNKQDRPGGSSGIQLPISSN